MGHDKAILEKLRRAQKHGLLDTLAIAYTHFDGTDLLAKMPVTPRVHQPMGLLHGGATVALGETLGSSLSAISVDTAQYRVMGIEIAANHIHSLRTGYVIGKACFIHKGRTTHLIEITVRDESKRLISRIKMTNIILPIEK
ncbi:MAG: hotdog fold thioesterase [Flavobacteriales bacterium]